MGKQRPSSLLRRSQVGLNSGRCSFQIISPSPLITGIRWVQRRPQFRSWLTDQGRQGLRGRGSEPRDHGTNRVQLSGCWSRDKF